MTAQLSGIHNEDKPSQDQADPALAAALPGEAEVQRKTWLVNAPVDLLFCCGGLLWIAVGLHALIVPTGHRGASFFAADSSWAERGFGLFLLASTYLFTYPHHAATWVRLYPNKELIKKYWHCTLLAPVIIAGMMALCITDSTAFSWAIRLNGIVTMQHWVAQCYGIGMIYFSRAGFPLAKMDRSIIWYLCQMLIAVVTLRLLSSPLAQLHFSMGRKIDPILLFSPQLASTLENGLFAISGVLFTVLAVRWFRAKLVPPLAVVALFLTIYRIGLNAADSCVDLFYYGLPLFHSMQYLLVASHFHARENQVLGKHESLNWKNFFGGKQMRKYIIGIAALGSSVYVLTPFFLQNFGVTYATGLLIAFMGYNFHHIFSDAFIWRLREPAISEKF